MVRSTSPRAVCGVGDHGDDWGRKVPGAEQSVEQETPLVGRCVEQDVSGSVWHREGGCLLGRSLCGGGSHWCRECREGNIRPQSSVWSGENSGQSLRRGCIQTAAV